MHLPIDYEALRLIWWFLLGVLLIGFAIMDGFDLGTAALLPFVARTDTQRRVAINAIGATWEGNQVWFILGGGAIFAAWPLIYATSFSGFYIALFLVLASLILRPVGFEFRQKIADQRWRSFWDYALCFGGIVPSLVFGVAVGNLFLGVPFRIEGDMRVVYEGTGLFELLNPFGLMCGLVSLTMLAGHGAAWLAFKTEGEVNVRARIAAMILSTSCAVLFLLAGIWVKQLDAYRIVSAVAPNGPSDPLVKHVGMVAGGWMDNYIAHPVLFVVPMVGVIGLLAHAAFTGVRWRLAAFIASGFGISGVIGTAGISLFPFIMPSSIQPEASLTVWDASSSHFTLFVMLCATLIFLPIVLTYTGLVFRVLRGAISEEHVLAKSSGLY